MKDNTNITNFSPFTHIIDDDVRSDNDFEVILPKSPEMCNKVKLKQKHLIQQQKLLREIMNTTTPITNFSPHPNTINNDIVCSLPPNNTINGDVIFPVKNMHFVN